MRKLSICFLIILTYSLSFSAAELPKNVKDAEWHKQLNAQFGKGTKRALLIAIDEYKPPLSPLHGCINDAHLLTEVLNRFCGYDVKNIHILANADATGAKIADKLTEILKASGESDTIFISYGGHGTLIEGKSYFCIYDMDPAKAKETALSADQLRETLQFKKIAQKILYIDSCHSGGANNNGLKQPEPSSQELTGPFEKASGIITFAGCRRSQSCIDFQNHGVFTGQFARGLAGDADFDKNGIVDSDEIYRHLLMEVPATAKMVDPKHEQTPVRIIGEDVVGVFGISKVDGKPQQLTGKLPVRPKVGDVIENSVGMKLIYLPADIVAVGSPNNEYLRNDDEAQQSVMINASIYMGIHEVTQDQFAHVMKKNPSYYSADGSGTEAVAGMKTGNLPVEQVSWDDAVEFCAKLSASPEEKKAKRAYRLPTECEWEFACRAGTMTVFATGKTLSSKQANIRGDKTYLDSEDGPTLGRTAAVGSYKPNAFGLYDMHGNVAEWCQDFYVDRRFPSFAGASYLESKHYIDPDEKAKMLLSFAYPQNPTGPSQGETRVYRGGAFVGDVAFARSAARREKAADYTYRGIGFRVVCYTKLLD